MDNIVINKYFKFGDEVEISTPQTTSKGKIVDLSDYVVVLEDATGNPIMLSIDNIISCKRIADIEPATQNNDNDHATKDDDIAIIIGEIIESFEDIYDTCSISKDEIIPTNATVQGLSSTGVEVMTDDGKNVICVKSSFVGYSRDNAAVGKRVYCHSRKNDNISYVSLTEMTYGEMYERFLRAVNTKPKPRTPILGSILLLVSKVYGNAIHNQKKTIKQLIKKLSNQEGFGDAPVTSTRIKLNELSQEQKLAIYKLLLNNISNIINLSENEKIKFAENLIFTQLNLKIRRVGIKAIVTDVIENGEGALVKIKSNNDGIQPKDLGHDVFISATCEVNRYYPQYHNGLASDSKNTDIRFKDDVVVEDSLMDELRNFQWWVKSNQPIPVVCIYKKVGKWQTASVVTKPGTLSEFKQRIQDLLSSGKRNLANVLQKYLESLGYYDSSIIHFSDETPSQELLATTRRKRLIKSFEEAEKGFLEIIRRNYELDASVRDLAMMYQEWGKSHEAIKLLEDYLPSLKDKMKVYNMLYIFYSSAGSNDKAIGVLENALNLLDGDDRKTKLKRDKILRKIDKIKNGKNKTSKSANTFSIGDIPSPLLRYEANNTTSEVFSYISTESFEKKWQFVNKRIDELRDTPDLPAYYLAKIQLLEERGESGTSIPVRMALADYCKARARNFLNEGNESSARAYLLQGISIAEREDLFLLLTISLCASHTSVLSKYNDPATGFEDISKEYSLREEDEVFSVLMQMLKKDSSMSRKLIRYLYESDASAWLFEELDLDCPAPQIFIEALSKMATSISKKLKAFEETASRILHETDPSAFAKMILEIPYFSSKEMLDIEIKNLMSLRDIANLIIDSENTNLTFEDSEELCRNAFSKIDYTVDEIEKKPSQISTISILPLLIKARDLMERSLDKRYMDTLPQITVMAIDDAHPIGDEIEIQLSILNEAGFSRANNGALKIDSINRKDVSKLALVSVLDTPLLGGNKVNVVFSLKSTLFDFENIDIEYTFTYLDVRKIKRAKHDQIHIAINKGNNYEDFENPYIAHVKSNAVKDPSMFKGRDDVIDTICKYVLEDYKGFVLYGQKRSGKSSVLYHITQRLRAEHKAFAVEYTMGNNIVQDSESENDSLANLFYTITSEIGRAIKEVDRKVYKESGCHIIRRQEFEKHPDQIFREYLDFYRDIIVDKLHYEQDKIVLIVDEFTYLYYHILEGRISSSIMEFWKGLVESRTFSFVFAGQDAMPRFMDDFQNVFASMHNQELTYIDETSARELIEEPIWDKKNNCSRFHPDAVNEIIKLTACSPFYIMILCSELVKYARQRKRLPIQASDVNALVQRMICNESSISRKDFDNLISCGESRLDIIDKDDSLKVLKDLAVKSRNVDFYDINAINVFDKEKVKSIVSDLLRRGVLEPHSEIPNKVRIKVELFKRWLLNHE